MNWDALTAATTVLLAVAGWGVFVERRLGKSLSREEHADICSSRNDETLSRINELIDTLKDDRDESRKYRDQQSLSITDLTTKVAVIEAHLTKPLPYKRR